VAVAASDIDAVRLVLRVRALLAMAESSAFTAEAASFAGKAGDLAERHGIDPDLLRFPREPLQVAVVVAELHRLQAALAAHAEETGSWATRTAEWSACLDEYDAVLEAAAEVLQFPVRRLPYGCRRRFRPEDRARIEAAVTERLAGG
jgi:hypothetical protein